MDYTIVFPSEDSYRIRSYSQSSGDSNNMLTTRNTYFKFKVRSCRDALVELVGEPNNPDTVMYSIKMGAENNTKVIIYKVTDQVQDEKAQYSESNLIDCDLLREFWVSWTKDGDDTRSIDFGRGFEVGKLKLLTFLDREVVPVQGLRMAQTTEEPHADWEFSRYAGNYRIQRKEHSEILVETGYHKTSFSMIF